MLIQVDHTMKIRHIKDKTQSSHGLTNRIREREFKNRVSEYNVCLKWVVESQQRKGRCVWYGVWSASDGTERFPTAFLSGRWMVAGSSSARLPLRQFVGSQEGLLTASFSMPVRVDNISRLPHHTTDGPIDRSASTASAP